jgi:hypothetical protein
VLRPAPSADVMRGFVNVRCRTRFMVCPVVDSCGFGCALHHATYCFIAALSDNRTVVFEHDARHWPHVHPLGHEYPSDLTSVGMDGQVCQGMH